MTDYLLGMGGGGGSSPIGTIIGTGGSTPPDSTWKLCDGSLLTQAGYPDLFAVIGHENAEFKGEPTSRTSQFGATNVNNVAYGNNTFVIVGGSGKISYSTDYGATWTAAGTNPLAANELYSLCYDTTNNLFIAAGVSGTLGTSPDGNIWTIRTSNIGANTCTEIVHSEELGMSIVSSTGGTLSYSTNGTTWTAASSAPTNSINGVCYSKAKKCFFAQTTVTSTVWYSYDGDIWINIPSGGGTPCSRSLEAIGNYLIYTTALAPDVVYISDFLYTGSRKIHHPSTYITHISYHNNTVIMCGNSGYIYVTKIRDIGVKVNTTWDQFATNQYCRVEANQTQASCYGNGVWVTVGYDGKVETWPVGNYNSATEFPLPNMMAEGNYFIKVEE